MQDQRSLGPSARQRARLIWIEAQVEVIERRERYEEAERSLLAALGNVADENGVRSAAEYAGKVRAAARLVRRAEADLDASRDEWGQVFDDAAAELNWD